MIDYILVILSNGKLILYLNMLTLDSAFKSQSQLKGCCSKSKSIGFRIGKFYKPIKLSQSCRINAKYKIMSFEELIVTVL